jgi:hypothetical protein
MYQNISFFIKRLELLEIIEINLNQREVIQWKNLLRSPAILTLDNNKCL